MPDNTRISADPTNFRTVFDKLVDVMDGVKGKSMSVEEGETIARAGFGAAKTLESDLHARIFEQKVARVGTVAAPAPVAPRAVGRIT